VGVLIKVQACSTRSGSVDSYLCWHFFDDLKSLYTFGLYVINTQSMLGLVLGKGETSSLFVPNLIGLVGQMASRRSLGLLMNERCVCLDVAIGLACFVYYCPWSDRLPFISGLK
jgi:hypothetical protein